MRAALSDGHPEAPLLVYVGRLGAEKNTEALKDILQQVPGARLALVGDGPQRAELEQMFRGLPVKFMVRQRRVCPQSCDCRHHCQRICCTCCSVVCPWRSTNCRTRPP